MGLYIMFTIVIIIICILMTLVILVQNPKGGGLGAGFGGGSSNVMGGVKQTTDFLEKATWVLVVSLFVLSIFINAFIPENTGQGGQSDTPAIEEILDNE